MMGMTRNRYLPHSIIISGWLHNPHTYTHALTHTHTHKDNSDSSAGGIVAKEMRNDPSDPNQPPSNGERERERETRSSSNHGMIPIRPEPVTHPSPPDPLHPNPIEFPN